MMLKKKANFIEELLKFMGDCLNESTLNHGNGKSNAARCIPQYFFENFEEEFKEVAQNYIFFLTKGQQKMEPSQVEAMLHESKIGKSNARVLFRHLNQFFGKSLFASEKV
jgi:hypothetical protein